MAKASVNIELDRQVLVQLHPRPVQERTVFSGGVVPCSPADREGPGFSGWCSSGGGMARPPLIATG